MPSKHRLLSAVAMLALAALTGCGLHRESFTYKLWHTDEFRHWREPATNAAVAVDYSPVRKDYLVTYNSLRDGDNELRRKSYFLGDYQSGLAEERKPRLVSTEKLELTSVPVNGATNPPCAHFDKALTIHAPEGEIGPYPLPTYVESDGAFVKTALTPLTVIGDVTCLSLLIGLIGVFAYAGSGASINGY
jgi:hypothetical protein